MVKKRKKENKINAEVTFKLKVLLREDKTINDLLKKETEFIAEPQSVNGCVMSMKLKSIKKI